MPHSQILKHRKGFTLVELSIVLVIIGLLIGGILIGQSLIDSVKISSVIREEQQYEVAIRLFKDKFKQLLGDYNNGVGLGAPSNGNGDGVIDCNWTSESIHVFYEMSITGLLKANLSAPPDVTPVPIINTNVMGSSTLKGDYFWVASSINNIEPTAHWANICTGNYFGAAASDQIGDNFLTLTRKYSYVSRGVYGVDPIFAKALDAKSDDGNPNTGDFRYGFGLDGSNWQVCVDNVGGDYRTSTYITGVPAYEPTMGCGASFKLRN